mmetsp:Transcript_4689/g.10534  ORF Transcript_4689/g.10534 Transcript_4689/m.10534 type:complete len:273 (+) Transcript_4689:137-955(+)
MFAANRTLVGRSSVMMMASSSGPSHHVARAVATAALSSARIIKDNDASPYSIIDSKNISLMKRFQSSSSAAATTNNDDDNHDVGPPWGDLFHAEISPSLVGKMAWIHRTFDPRSNAQAMLTCGGEDLAKHASFDPSYDRARSWITNHAVGPAVLSPVLINGLVGALVEASFPQSIPIGSDMQQIRPLIVGVEVCAKIQVVEISDTVAEDVVKASLRTMTTAASSEDAAGDSNPVVQKQGFLVNLETNVTHVRDSSYIAKGSHRIWIPDYLHM